MGFNVLVCSMQDGALGKLGGDEVGDDACDDPGDSMGMAMGNITGEE
jgi:hypothetical protein